MDINPAAVGKLYEDRALDFLQTHGLRLVERNYSCRYGEIDLILWDEEELVFVEVRRRKDLYYGGALMSIDAKKKNRLERSGEYYIACNYSDADIPPYRFDLFGFTGDEMDWIKSFN